MEYQNTEILSPLTTPHQQEQEQNFKSMENAARRASSSLPPTTIPQPPTFRFFYDHHQRKRDYKDFLSRFIPEKHLHKIAKSYAYELFGCASLIY